MTDRRPSLIDQMALAAALEADLNFTSDDDGDSADDDDLLLGDEDMGDPSDQRGRMVFNSDVIQEFGESEDEEDDDIDDDGVVIEIPATTQRRPASTNRARRDLDELASAPSGTSEDDDAFTDNPLPMGFQWHTPIDDTVDSGSFHMASVSESFDLENPSGELDRKPSSQQQYRRTSFQALPETSFNAENENLSGPGPGMLRRNHSIRRPSIKITVAGSASAVSDDEDGDSNVSSTSASSMFRFGRLSSISSSRRQNLSARSGRSGTDVENALDSLSTHETNSQWDNVAAAVTIVAASEKASANSTSRHRKFAVNDTVLVLLTLLNVTNVEDPKDTFTVAPVNRYGFPQGEGRTEDEKGGPYTFVLAAIKHVHFDEDDRYYTVVRADTGTEQRADSGWIEPLNDPAGVDAATRAAKLTVRSAQDKPVEILEEAGYLRDAWDLFMDVIAWPADFSRITLLPWYRMQRKNAKDRVAQLLFGDAPFACRIHITGINFLVLCSFWFLFMESINLAFCSASLDMEFSIIGGVIWSILVLELIFEVVIRPQRYSELIQSDRAFAPSTARYINRFHLIFEGIALITYVPNFVCLAPDDVCWRESRFSRVLASMDAIIGKTHAQSAKGRFFLGLTVLRLFGLIRHWKQMFISNTFQSVKREGIEKWLIPGQKDHGDSILSSTKRHSKKRDDDNESVMLTGDEYMTRLTSSEEDQRLKNAATIGTALMVVNSQRALLLLTSIVLVLPMLGSLSLQNLVSYNMVDLLQAQNLAAPSSSEEDCSYLKTSVQSWLRMATTPQPSSRFANVEDTFVLWAQILPVRCDFQREDGVITFCSSRGEADIPDLPSLSACTVWDDNSPATPEDATEVYFAEQLSLRSEGIRQISRQNDTYTTSVIYNYNPSVALLNMGEFFLLVGILLLGLYGLNSLRGEAIRLVLDPLQRMLKIVLRYAENPLSQDVKDGSNKKDDDSVLDGDAEEIGNYETEQLINAITKIADLLRKCWGVAGAGIISSNLARTKDGKTVVFNPTVPGKRVYALFGFVAINGFSEQLRALDRDVMILINDVAKVVHDEVYRWALGKHGQCNKNLGAAFLMVFRIGDFSEVHKKKKVATEKLFRDNAKTQNKKSSNLRRRYTSRSSIGRPLYGGRKGARQDGDGHLQLASLPGIQTFTDRALLGMLKSFAGVHRDKQLTRWKNDFRLSAGVSAYHVDIIYGMDAGWAVEGAVGSEYKIDATYLSPHVNMASRMMSASKQYGVTILLSKAVEELLSRTCRKKLRHLDTVYVKGSNVKQEIFTFDARYRGVDFFLLERTPEQADMDAESYTPNIWEHDQDLRAMRQHVSDEFLEMFHLGVKLYLGGKWRDAYNTLERANDLMMETILEDGYLEYDMEELEGRLFERNDKSEDIVRVRNELGDGACRVLMNYMERRKLRPPDDWDGVRQLSSK